MQPLILKLCYEPCYELYLHHIGKNCLQVFSEVIKQGQINIFLWLPKYALAYAYLFKLCLFI